MHELAACLLCMDSQTEALASGFGLSWLHIAGRPNGLNLVGDIASLRLGIVDSSSRFGSSCQAQRCHGSLMVENIVLAFLGGKRTVHSADFENCSFDDDHESSLLLPMSYHNGHAAVMDHSTEL